MPRRLCLLFAGAALAAGVPAFAAPGDMSAASWLAKYEKVRAQGMGALFSDDAKQLRAEAMAAGQAFRERIKADRAAGKTPPACPPPKSAMNSTQLVAHLRSYPPGRRAALSLTSAIGDFMAKTYPCP